MSQAYVGFPQRKKGLMYAWGTALCWGVLAILLKNALKFTDSETIVAFRMIFAFILLSSFSLIKAPKNFKVLKKPPLLLLVGSLALAFNYLGFMKGVALSGASNAQIMIQAGPLVLMLTGFLFYKEGLKALQLFWICVSVVGFIFFFKDQAAFIESSSLLSANIWILSGALAWVAYSLMIKGFTKRGYSTSELNLVVFLVCSFALAYNLSLAHLMSLTVFQWLFLMILGANTLIAYGCFGAALNLAPASQVSIIITLNPVLTLGIIALAGDHFSFIPNEPTSLLGYIGAGLVVTGVVFSTLSAQKKRAKNKV